MTRPEYGKPETWPRIPHEDDPPVLVDVTPDSSWVTFEPDATPLWLTVALYAIAALLLFGAGMAVVGLVVE